jgi:hypothetical protein
MNQLELRFVISLWISGALYACTQFSGEEGMPEVVTYILAILLLSVYAALLLADFTEMANTVGALPFLLCAWEFWLVSMWPLAVLCVLVPVVFFIIREVRSRRE